MTSLSSLSSTAMSPRAQMDARIASAASAGSISSADQTALTSVLDSIDTSLSLSSGASASGPKSMKERIDSLIQAQVSAGTLSDDQASELKSFFAQGPAGGPPPSGSQPMSGTDGQGGVGGPQGAGRPDGPPPPPPSAGTDSTDQTSSTSSSSTLDDQLKRLEQMLASLRQSLTANADSYGATASSGLVLNGVA